MPELNPGARIDLGRGYSLNAPFRGTAQRLEPGEAGTRAREVATDTLDEALARHSMQSVATIDISNIRPAPVAEGALRDSSGQDVMLFEVPDFGAEAGQVVISVDEAGAVRWNFPVLDDGAL